MTPFEPVQKPDSDIVTINFRRMKSFLPTLTGVALVMFVLAFAIHDSLSIRIANGALLALFSGLTILSRTRHAAALQQKGLIHFLIDIFAIGALLWGTTLLGFNANSMITYFDFLVSFFVVPLIILMPDRKILVYYSLSLAYLLLLTPVLHSVHENHLLFMISIILFIIVSFASSRISYRQFQMNLNLTTQLYEQQVHLSELVQTQSKALVDAEDKMSREVIRILAKVLDDFDPYTRGHSENVARLAEDLARYLDYPEKFQHELFWVGMIHDIGKIRIPKYILNKPGKLTDEEFERIRKHPQYGYEMIRESEALRPLADIVLSHHEHYDGKGYPNHLVGDQIPLASQILAIVDSWDAMLSQRVYRESMTLEYAKNELIRCSGKQFAPHLVNCFLNMIDEQRREES